MTGEQLRDLVDYADRPSVTLLTRLVRPCYPGRRPDALNDTFRLTSVEAARRAAAQGMTPPTAGRRELAILLTGCYSDN